jgi:cbb3-type cytochrome oxidase cytochrome c subunit
MKKRFNTKRILIGLAIVFVIIQAFRIDKSTPPTNPAEDFLALESMDDSTAMLFRAACYDCHSNVINYPWYTNIAPVSWWIKHHIDEGSHHLNFSTWGTYTVKRKHHKMEECIEMIEEGEMPLASYTWMHSEAKLSATEQAALLKVCKEILVKYESELQATEK